MVVKVVCGGEGSVVVKVVCGESSVVKIVWW